MYQSFFCKNKNIFPDFHKKGRKITIEIQVIRCMNKLINRLSRSARTEMSLDLLIEENTPIVEIPVEDNNDYSNVDKII